VHEYRQNPLTGNWIILAPRRGDRPQQFSSPAAVAPPRLPSRDEQCDFCPGNERRTAPEIYALRDDYSTVDGPGWQVRVVPNKYPAVTIDAEPVPSPDEVASGKWKPASPADRLQPPLRQSRPAVGMHEVIIESPAHDRHFALHDDRHATLLVQALRHRCRMVMQARDVRYACVGKNHGSRSGASIRHPHFQLVATAGVPPAAGRMIERQETFARENGRPLFDALLEDELSAASRIIAAADHFVVLAPWASQTPYETWIIPRASVNSFRELPDDQTAAFAVVLRDTLRRIHRRLDDPDYNLIIHDAPKGDRAREHHRWFVQILPRMISPAAFELGTGVFINHVPPESAAACLREMPV